MLATVFLRLPRLASTSFLCVAFVLFVGCGRPASEPARPSEDKSDDSAQPQPDERQETTNTPDAVKNADKASKSKPGASKQAKKPQRTEAELKNEAKRKECEKLVRAGESDMKSKKYAEAAQKFEEALQAVPEDKAAKEKLDQARAKIADLTGYEKHIKEGNLALEKKKYADAVKSFNEALKLKPGDPAAAQGLRRAEAALKGKK